MCVNRLLVVVRTYEKTRLIAYHTQLRQLGSVCQYFVDMHVDDDIDYVDEIYDPKCDKVNLVMVGNRRMKKGTKKKVKAKRKRMQEKNPYADTYARQRQCIRDMEKIDFG